MDKDVALALLALLSSIVVLLTVIYRHMMSQRNDKPVPRSPRRSNRRRGD